jgi:glycosyltransferase involved in cell wall biosynthesis
MNNIKELGSISDERLMSIIYSAADVFVIPSLMDNLPNTVLEALMCGTPVIGFPVGGIPDMVQNGFNGLISHEVNSHSLFETIEIFLNTKDSYNSDEIRIDALSKYSTHIQAKKYLKLYKNILNT